MNIRERVNQASARPAGGAVFIDFTPTQEWRADEEGSAVLVLSLPGFTREQIKVTAEPSGIIRVRGLRRVGGRNWSRFNSEFRVPEECSMAGIRAKYVQGNLYITIPKPKVIPAQPLSPSLPSEPQHAQPSSPLKQSRLQPPPHPLGPPVLQSEPMQPQQPQLPSEPKQEEMQAPPHIQPNPQMAASIPSIESEKTPIRSHEEPSSERYYSANKEEELTERENPESFAERILKGGTEKRKEHTATAGTTEEMEQLRKEHLDRRARETEAVIGTRLCSDLKLEDYMQITRSKLSADRQTLVNMGAAALVIAGLGIYICCNIGGKINN